MIDKIIPLLRAVISFGNMITVIVFLNNIMESNGKREKWMNPIVFLLLFIYRFRAKFITSDNKYEILVIGGICLLYLTICKKERVVEKLFWSFFITTSFTVHWLFCFSTIAFFSNTGLKSVIYEKTLYVFALVVSQCIQSFIFYRVYKRKDKLKHYISEVLIFFILLISFNLYRAHYLLENIYYQDLLLNVEDIFFLAGVFIFTVGSIEILEIFSKQIESITSINIKERQNFQMKRHTQEIYEVFEKLKGWRHDWRNHLITMNYLLENREIDRLSSYLEKIGQGTGDIFSYIDVIKSNIPVLDALFNSKAIIAKNQGIKMTVDVELNDKELKIDEVDLCTLIGNLLDNAIEANPEGGVIATTVQTIRGNLILIMENSVNRKIMVEKERFITTKKDKESHGIGLLQIDEIVNKYEGYLKRELEKNRFVTKIMIPL